MTITAPVTTTDRRKLTVVRADRLFDGTDVLDDPVVVIDRSTIVAVDRAGQFTTTDHAEVVDLAGATLLPGLIDTHVHLCFDAGTDVVGSLAEQDDDATLAAMTRAARNAVAGGVTTVRDLGDRGYLSLGLRDSAEPGLPTVIAAGPPITSVGGHCHFLGGEVRGEAGIRAGVREHAERGVDVIKIMASGGHLTPGSRSDQAQFTAEELRAAVTEAHAIGLPVTAHVHGISATFDAIAAGVDGLEHVTFESADGIIHAPADLVGAIVESGAVLGLTLGIVPDPDFPMPAFIRESFPTMMANVGVLVGSGARIVLGSDAGIAPVKPHDVLRHSVLHLAQFGRTPAQALHTATVAAADALGVAQRKGRLAPGFDADILAVDGDPTEDLSALHRIRAVYLRGSAVSGAAAAVRV